MSARFKQPPKGSDAPLALVPPTTDDTQAGGVDVFAASAARAGVVGGTLSFLKRRKAQKVKKIQASLGTPGDYARTLMQVPHPAEWEQALRELSPVSEAHSFLVFAWKQPPLETDKGRWCLYEGIPDALIGVERRIELEAAPYWVRETPAERQAQAQIVSAYQWEMYRQHRLDVRPFWCLQGVEGGTPLHHTPQERKWLRLMGTPEWPVAVGELPFAGWDNRVKGAVLNRDRLSRLGGNVTALRRSGTPEALRDEAEQAEQAWRRAFWDTTADRMAPATELYGYLLRSGALDGHRQRQSAEDATAAAEAREHFIRTGDLPTPRKYRKRRIFIAQ